MARKCGKCGKKGHNARTCGRPKESSLNTDSGQQNKTDGFRRRKTCSVCKQPGHTVKTCKQLGYQVLEKEKEKVNREDINGIKPAKGIWIVRPRDEVIYGRIAYVRRNGKVVWDSVANVRVESDQHIFEENGYVYTENPPIGWKFKSFLHKSNPLR